MAGEMRTGRHRAPRLRLLDGSGSSRDEFEAADTLLVSATGLRPATPHRIRVTAGDDEVFDVSVVSDLRGRLVRFVVWPDIGIGRPGEGGRYAFDRIERAHEALSGTSFALELESSGRLIGRAGFVLSRELARRRLFPVDRDGAFTRGLLGGEEDLVVQGWNFPEEALVDVYLVHRQLDWRPGDPIAPAKDRAGQEILGRATTARERTGFSLLLVRRDHLPPGSYDLVARVVLPHEFRGDDRRLKATDFVSDRFLTTLVVRDDVWSVKPIQLGCVMAMRQIAGTPVPGPPYFEFTNNFPVGTPVWAALDPAGLMPDHIGRKLRYSVVAHKTATQWGSDSTLADVTGSVHELITTAGCVNGNAMLVWPNPPTPGRYDLVADFGNNDPDPANFAADDSFDPPVDMIDGYFTVGFHVTVDPSLPGPFAVGISSYNDPAVTIPAVGVWAGPGPPAGSTPSGTLSLPLRADVRYPADTAGIGVPFSTVRQSYPVVIVMHGQSYVSTSYQGYTYLLEHLATHGFVAMSIDCIDINQIQGMQDTRGHAVLAHLEHLQQKNGNPGLFQGKLDLGSIGLMGHSRGGDGVVQAEVFNQALALGWNIKALVSLAPTDFSGTSPTPMVLNTSTFLCIFGGEDQDVGTWIGVPKATGYTGTGFRLYDRATVEKSMVFAYGATHNRFNTQWGVETYVDVSSPAVLTEAQHHTLLSGYVAAFMQLRLLGRTEQVDYFNGELRIPALAGVPVSVQYRHQGRRTVDEFEGASTPSMNALGGAITPVSLLAPPREGMMIDLDYHSPHQTRGVSLKWNSAVGRYQSTVPVGAQRDVSSYRFLSFRAGQTVSYLFDTNDNIYSGGSVVGQHSVQLGMGVVDSDLRTKFTDHRATLSGGASATTIAPGSKWLISDAANGQWFTARTQYVPYPGYPYTALLVERTGPGGQPLGPPGVPQDLYVRLSTSGGGPSRAVRAGYFGAIPPPWRPHYIEDAWYTDVNDDNVMAILSTVRIPLSAWTIKCLSAPIVDLTNVEAVTFEVSLVSSGDLLLDDIEFTQ